MAIEQHAESDASAGTGAGAEASGAGGAGARSLGIERWVQLAFFGLAVIGFLVFEKVIGAGWDALAGQVSAVPEVNGVAVTGLSAICATILFFVLYKHPKTHRLAHEIAHELALVTWPNRKETWAATVVVIVTSIVAAIIMFFYDALWSALTDIVY